MKYVSVKMLSKHSGKAINTMRRALKLGGVEPQKFPGVRGVRIAVPVANKFLGKHWPEVAPLSAE